jgi:dolichyl-phosphate beta-glucosyltransferase
MIAHLTARESADKRFSWEVIIVDDGSTDASAAIAMSYVQKQGSDRVRLLKLAVNSGKGAAVRKGMMRGRGQYLLMADADGATQFSDVDQLLEAIGAADTSAATPTLAEIAIGSRAKMQRTWLRSVLHRGFTFGMSLLMGYEGIEDTQCGFKLFSREAAKRIFPALHIERWAFDVEMVYLAKLQRIRTLEVPVQWHEVGGSKVHILKDALNMARDVSVIRLCYALGWWRAPVPGDPQAQEPADGPGFGALPSLRPHPFKARPVRRSATAIPVMRPANPRPLKRAEPELPSSAPEIFAERDQQLRAMEEEAAAQRAE